MKSAANRLEATPDNVAAVMNEFLEPDNTVFTGETKIDEEVYRDAFPQGADDLLALGSEFHDRFGVVVSVTNLHRLSDRITVTSDSVEMNFDKELDIPLLTVADIAKLLTSKQRVTETHWS